ncbi:MAG: SRPBCC domain-containing protein [Actinomycetota bacterium]
MRIENTVEVDAPLDRVWALVNDIPRVAPCMPGAALTGVLDDKTYEGTVAVKLGPLRMSYKGKVVVEEVDEANHSARLAASGRDTKGAGTARASVTTRLEPAGDTHTRLQVTSDVQLTGKVASFGRGGAINDVATRLFGQFADCLRATLEGEPAATAAAEGAAGTAGAGAAAATGGTAATAGGAEAATVEDRAASGPAGTTPDATPRSPAAEPAPASAPTPSGTTEVPTSPAATQAPTAPTSTGGPAAMPTAGTPSVPATSPPRSVEALDAGSLVGTVVKGRLRAWGQAIARFFRRLFGRRSTG